MSVLVCVCVCVWGGVVGLGWSEWGGRRDGGVLVCCLYSVSFVSGGGERMEMNEKRVTRPPKAARLEIHFEGKLNLL